MTWLGDVVRQLELAEQAMADAARYRKLKAAYCAANFKPEDEMDLPPGTVLMFLFDEGTRVSVDLDETVDGAIVHPEMEKS